jgi:small-conductance mechanosensitive channel
LKKKQRNKLTSYFNSSNKSRICLSFEEIEDIIDDKLPNIALKNPEWWSNNPKSKVAQCWINNGYRTRDIENIPKTRGAIFQKEAHRWQRIAIKFLIFPIAALVGLFCGLVIYAVGYDKVNSIVTFEGSLSDIEIESVSLSFNQTSPYYLEYLQESTANEEPTIYVNLGGLANNYGFNRNATGNGTLFLGLDAEEVPFDADDIVSIKLINPLLEVFLSPDFTDPEFVSISHKIRPLESGTLLTWDSIDTSVVYYIVGKDNKFLGATENRSFIIPKDKDIFAPYSVKIDTDQKANYFELKAEGTCSSGKTYGSDLRPVTISDITTWIYFLNAPDSEKLNISLFGDQNDQYYKLDFLSIGHEGFEAENEPFATVSISKRDSKTNALISEATYPVSMRLSVSYFGNSLNWNNNVKNISRSPYDLGVFYDSKFEPIYEFECDSINSLKFHGSGDLLISKGTLVNDIDVAEQIIYMEGLNPSNVKARIENTSSISIVGDTNSIKLEDRSIDPNIIECYFDLLMHDRMALIFPIVTGAIFTIAFTIFSQASERKKGDKPRCTAYGVLE